MINDYKNWLHNKEQLLHHLRHHSSIVMDRMSNIFVTLDYITSLKEDELNDDYEFIFDCGFSYLFTIVSEIELLLEKYFDNSIHIFLEYEVLINYLLYINDLKETLIENEDFNEDADIEFNNVCQEIEEIISKKQTINDNLLEMFDDRILSTFKAKKEHITTPEVFDRIAEELQII